MNINSINYLPGKTLNISKSQNHMYILQPLKSDIVSFSGKKHVKKENSNTAKAVEFGEKLIHLPLSQKIDLDYISSLLPDIQVKPIGDLRFEIPDSQNYMAFYSGILSPDFEAVENKIYLNVEDANKNPVNRLGFIMNSAHEYTHFLQSKQGEAREYLKSVSKGDHEYAKIIQGGGLFAFKPFDNDIQAKFCVPTFQCAEDIENLKKYGMIVPRERQVSKQDILHSAGFSTEKDFKNYINYTFNNIVREIVKSFINDPLISQNVKDKEHLDKLYAKIKKYCAIKAKDEKEAYTTESDIAKKAMKTDSSLNIDIFSIYYDMLEKALS